MNNRRNRSSGFYVRLVKLLVVDEQNITGLKAVILAFNHIIDFTGDQIVNLIKIMIVVFKNYRYNMTCYSRIYYLEEVEL